MNDLRKIKYNSNTAGFKVRVILNVEKHGKLDAERESSVFLKLMCNWLAAVTDDDETSEESEHASMTSNDDGDL